MYGSLHVCTYARLYACMHVCLHACMFACSINVYISLCVCLCHVAVARKDVRVHLCMFSRNGWEKVLACISVCVSLQYIKLMQLCLRVWLLCGAQIPTNTDGGDDDAPEYAEVDDACTDVAVADNEPDYDNHDFANLPPPPARLSGVLSLRCVSA